MRRPLGALNISVKANCVRERQGAAGLTDGWVDCQGAAKEQSHGCLALSPTYRAVSPRQSQGLRASPAGARETAALRPAPATPFLHTRQAQGKAEGLLSESSKTNFPCR